MDLPARVFGDDAVHEVQELEASAALGMAVAAKVKNEKRREAEKV